MLHKFTVSRASSQGLLLKACPIGSARGDFAKMDMHLVSHQSSAIPDGMQGRSSPGHPFPSGLGGPAELSPGGALRRRLREERGGVIKGLEQRARDQKGAWGTSSGNLCHESSILMHCFTQCYSV